MNQAVSPVVLIIAIIAVVLLVGGIYRMTVGGSAKVESVPPPAMSQPYPGPQGGAGVAPGAVPAPGQYQR